MKNLIKLLVASLIALSPVTASAAITLNSTLVDTPSLAHDATYVQDLQGLKISGLSGQAVIGLAPTPAPSTFQDGTQSTGTITVTDYTVLSATSATNSITVASTSGLRGATIAVPGYTLKEGIDWAVGATTSLTAASIQSAFAKVTFLQVSRVGAVVTLTAPLGTAYNSTGLTTTAPSQLTIATPTFTGGRNNAVVTINGVALTQGTQWSAGASTTAAALSLSNAINSALGATLTSSPSGGVVSLLSDENGSVFNYKLASSVAAITLSGSLMTGGTDPDITVGSTLIEVLDHDTSLGEAVLFTGSGYADLTSGTTYFSIPVSADSLRLATSKSNALIGTAIEITSVPAHLTANTATLSPIAASGAPGLKWQSSDDGSSWTDLSVSSLPSTVVTSDPSEAAWNFGTPSYRFIRANVAGPTTGGVTLTLSIRGSDSLPEQFPSTVVLGDIAGATGIPLPPDVATNPSYTFQVATDNGDYSTVGAAITGIQALGLPSGATVNIVINGGNYTESPFVLPNRFALTGLRFAQLNFNSASPAVTIPGLSAIEGLGITNSGGPALDVLASSGTTLRNLSATGASGYGIRLTSGTINMLNVGGIATSGHGIWILGNANPQGQVVTAQTSGGGHALFYSGASGGGAWINSTFNGHNGFASVMLSTGAPRFQGVSICAKSGQHAIDAAFPTTSGIGSGLITYTNSCVGGGGLSRTLGSNVQFYPNQGSAGLQILNNFAAGSATDYTLWATSSTNNRGLVVWGPGSACPGCVGIGTPFAGGVGTPTSGVNLQVNGNARVGSSNSSGSASTPLRTQNPNLPAVNGASARLALSVGNSAASNIDVAGIGGLFEDVTLSSGSLVLLTNGGASGSVLTERARITSSGLFGIGTTAPTGLFTVVDATGIPSTGYDEANPAPAGNLVSTSSGTVVRMSGVNGYALIGSGGIHGFGFDGLGGYMTGVCHNGDEITPTACADGDLITFIGGKPYDGSTPHSQMSSKAAIQMTAAENSAVGANGTSISLDTTLIGTSTRRQRQKIYDTGRISIAPRANTVTPLGLLHLQGTDGGIGITGNGVSLYATEALVTLSTVTATGVFSSGEVQAGGGSNILYWCSAPTDPTQADVVVRTNVNAATNCAGGTLVPTSVKVD